jgi:DNA-directed RNA polymerase specialized sigma24 family protein
MTEKKPYDTFDMTQQEVGDALGMSRGHVGYVEERAKKKLKEALEKRGFKLEDFLGGMV